MKKPLIPNFLNRNERIRRIYHHRFHHIPSSDSIIVTPFIDLNKCGIDISTILSIFILYRVLSPPYAFIIYKQNNDTTSPSTRYKVLMNNILFIIALLSVLPSQASTDLDDFNYYCLLSNTEAIIYFTSADSTN